MSGGGWSGGPGDGGESASREFVGVEEGEVAEDGSGGSGREGDEGRGVKDLMAVAELAAGAAGAELELEHPLHPVLLRILPLLQALVELGGPLQRHPPLGGLVRVERVFRRQRSGLGDHSRRPSYIREGGL